MNKKILFLRTSYWLGAIADLSIAISILIPQRVGLDKFVYPMGLMSAVAFSWAIMLILADRKPLERKWVLIPTILVIFLLSTVRIISVVNGLIDFSLAYLFLGIFLAGFMSYSYYYAVKTI
jgi:drug/metabolite transporter (DMT)-like permease